MSKPKRIQRKRTKGWRMPPNTVSVTRPGKFGNPFSACYLNITDAESVAAFKKWLAAEESHAVMRKKRRVILDSIHELRGKNLACWCKPHEPCHAEVLLEMANE